MQTERTPEEIACFKAMLIDYIGSGIMTTDAMAQLGISWRELARWRKQDTAFAEEYTDVTEHLCQVKADQLSRIHETVLDPKRATVAFNAGRWWLEKKNPKVFGQKPVDLDENPHLVEVLRAAIERVFQDRLPPIPLTADNGRS